MSPAAAAQRLRDAIEAERQARIDLIDAQRAARKAIAELNGEEL